MSDAELIDTLNEAARYMRTLPDVSRRLIDKVWDNSTDKTDFAARIRANLMVAWKFATVEPDVAAGYCHGAAFEIQARGGVEP